MGLSHLNAGQMKFDSVDKVGDGTYGEVYLATCVDAAGSEHRYAVKKYEERSIGALSIFMLCCLECFVLKK